MKMLGKKTTNDIRVLCVKATSFPAGIMEAFKKIESADPEFCRRTFYGLSRGQRDGGIEYWAAVTQDNPSEGKATGLDQKVIASGNYASIMVKNFRSDTAAIGNAFSVLLRHPDLDRNTWCVEVYGDNDVECMVRLAD